MAPTKSSKGSTKPYDRPSSSLSTSVKGKGKGKAPSTSTEVNIGAPSTLGQSSRKGKKAWRKNIDITVEEGALERGREEERVTGGSVASKSNNDLFTVDVTGDVEVGKRARRAHKPLRSLSILSERSAVPSLTSKPTSSTSSSKKTKSHVSSAEKERLRRIARRSTAHPDERVTSADIRKLDPNETKDVWQAEKEVRVKGGFGEETIIKKQVKLPTTLAKQREIYLNSQVENGIHLEIPKGGVSYNPTLESHQSLINDALKEEMELQKREEESAKQIEERGGVVENRRVNWVPSEFAEGMVVGPGEIDEDEESDEEGEVVAKKQSKRKTTAQRNKALRQKMAQQAAAAELEKRKLVKSVASVAAYKKEVERKMQEQREKERIAKLAKAQKAKMGVQEGEKVGKYRLNRKRVEVQLGEDLAESLRQVKPEGNLFKDRFLALQKRALIEPRVPVLPKKRVTKLKEYEKHAYKRFE
ncbi:hypothetical protein I302_103258 [Kwoniella bestiolae CBS 10118]|uniref:Ribosome biogenesis protein NOP53 n=1 Tax=Kwoniella bestiolae CBS 10118 TaxID=1296100 RepID=A0A1B9G7X7_9TREE|nr:nucleolar protein 53 [Kwoniella bestiolae CBS 10118]OCF27122.1 nucleolar protein 53 [Kwoniella bestiolae CBS 10118]